MLRFFYNQSCDCCNVVRRIVFCTQAPVEVSQDSTSGALDILLIGYGMCFDIKADIGLLHSS